jgi:PII-like signaling protein
MPTDLISISDDVPIVIVIDPVIVDGSDRIERFSRGWMSWLIDHEMITLDEVTAISSVPPAYHHHRR